MDRVWPIFDRALQVFIAICTFAALWVAAFGVPDSLKSSGKGHQMTGGTPWWVWVLLGFVPGAAIQVWD
jgi:hypothetical protein